MQACSFGLLSLLALTPSGHAQASYTASRAGDLQVGVGFSIGVSNYLTPQLGASFTPALIGNGETVRGFDIYGDFDFTQHFGAELNFRETHPNFGADSYERTYEVGGRYVYPSGRLRPYAKVSYGRGVFNYPYGIANLAYNLYGIGGGADYRATQSVNVRLEYEYQHWLSFPLRSLEPSVLTIGVAYHFSGEGKCKLCANR